MASSGTVGSTVVEVADIFDHAIRRVGLTPAALTTEVSNTLSRNLYMLLSFLSNRGVNLWRVERSLMGIYLDQAKYTLTTGTLDVLNALYRTPSRLEGTVTTSAAGTVAYVDDGDVDTILTQTSSGGNVRWEFTEATTVNMVGLLPGATGTLALTFQVSDDAVTWTTVRTITSQTFTDKVWYWYEIEPAQEATYFRVAASSGTIIMREIYLCEDWQEVTMARMNRDDYSNLPFKRNPGEPLQYWLDRQLTPVMNLWPVPSTTFAAVSLWSHMHIEDVGALSNTLNIPQRWYDAVVANLAFNSLMDIPGADVTRYPNLKDMAQTTMANAEMEERDASPTRWTPNIQPYTR